jgi:nitrogen fixation/metabolism regulation signal transduction histidine kinase
VEGFCLMAAAPPEPDTDAPPETDAATKTSAWSTALGLIALAVLVILGVVVLYRIYPGQLAEKANPGFLDNVFNNNLVVFAARLVLVSSALVLAFLGAHLIWSVVRWFRLGHLVTKLGPLQVSEHAVQTLRAELEFWRGQASALNDQVQALTDQLEENEQLLEDLLGEDGDDELLDEDLDLDDEGNVEEDRGDG